MTGDAFEVAARYYDEDYRALGYDADVEFYVGLARESGGRVLEMGCGTGRILLPTARAGVRIHGVDLSARMLEQLEKKITPELRERISYSQGDIRTVEAGGGYALVTAPFRVVQFLLSREDQRAWLRNVRRHLAPGGALCFDVFQPNYAYLAGPREPFVEVDRVEAGRRVQRVTRTTLHNEWQRMEVEFRWVVDGREEASRTMTLRWFTRGELENLLELEGFEIRDYWGSFRREAFGEGSAEQVIRATVRV